MTDETNLTPEQEQAAEQEAFAEAFNEVRGEPGEEMPAPVEVAPEDPALLEAVAEEEDKPDPRYEALLAKMSDIDRMRSGFDKLSGHVGTILQQLQEFKQAQAAPLREPEPELPKVDPKEFVESYPEFASYLRDQLQAVQQSFPVNDVMQRVAEVQARNAALEASLEEERITRMHPDWAEVVNTDGYKAWLATQAPDVQQVARETVYARDLGQIIGAYKATAQKAQNQAKRQQRLEAALAPGAVAQPPKVEPTEDENFHAGWAGVRGRGL